MDLADNLGRKISLKTAMVDVLSAANFLRVPVLIEYDELKKLQVNAATDALTGLHNRRLFDEYFEKEMNRAKRYGQQLAIVILDLHKLKEVNDRHGHLQGDQVLQIAAATLRRTLRSSDFAFRIGETNLRSCSRRPIPNRPSRFAAAFALNMKTNLRHWPSRSE